MTSENIHVVPTPSITVSTSGDSFSPVRSVGSSVTMNCTVELSSTVMESDLSLLMVDAQLSRDGTPLTLTDPIVTGTTFTYTTQLSPFGRTDSGNYTCNATVRPQSLTTATYLIASKRCQSDVIKITTGRDA